MKKIMMLALSASLLTGTAVFAQTSGGSAGTAGGGSTGTAAGGSTMGSDTGTMNGTSTGKKHHHKKSKGTPSTDTASTGSMSK